MPSGPHKPALENKLVDSNALFSQDRKYRYILWRTWNVRLPYLVWIMLNPSKADEIRNDATVRRCMGFAKAWGFGGIEIYNLFAYVTTYPDFLRKVLDPVGLKNDDLIRGIPKDRKVVIAWGNIPRLELFNDRAQSVLKLLNRDVQCLGCTKDGNPRHPVRLANVTTLQSWLQILERGG